MPFAATWMDREIVILSEVSQTEKENRLTDLEIELTVAGERMGGWDS